jgi:hypothetical protein
MDIGTVKERTWFYEAKSVIIQIIQSNSKYKQKITKQKNRHKIVNRLQYINLNMAILYTVIS